MNLVPSYRLVKDFDDSYAEKDLMHKIERVHDTIGVLDWTMRSPLAFHKFLRIIDTVPCLFIRCSVDEL